VQRRDQSFSKGYTEAWEEKVMSRNRDIRSMGAKSNHVRRKVASMESSRMKMTKNKPFY
jgi:hypothetical protein